MISNITADDFGLLPHTDSLGLMAGDLLCQMLDLLLIAELMIAIGGVIYLHYRIYQSSPEE